MLAWFECRVPLEELHASNKLQALVDSLIIFGKGQILRQFCGKQMHKFKHNKQASNFKFQISQMMTNIKTV